jgi:GAF domain-containing protein
MKGQLFKRMDRFTMIDKLRTFIRGNGLQTKFGLTIFLLFSTLYLGMSVAIYLNQKDKLTSNARAVLQQKVYDAESLLLLQAGSSGGQERLMKERLLGAEFLFEGAALFVADQQGTLLMHLLDEGETLPDRQAVQYLTAQGIQEGAGLHRYRKQEGATRAWWWLAYRYLPGQQKFVGVILPEQAILAKPLGQLMALLSSLFVVSVLITLFVLQKVVLQVNRPIKEISLKLKELSLGKQVKAVQSNRKDEIDDIFQSLNALIDGLTAYTTFAGEIGNGNFEATFQPLSQEDQLGNSLLAMSANLEKAAAEERKRKWAIEGMARFAELIRTHTDGLNTLSDQVLAALVKYVNAHQGAIFISETLESQQEVLEMVSCHAFNRKKFLYKQVEPGEGMVGQVYLEKDTVLLTEIPPHYIKVRSGLGESLPRCLLFVPVMFNEKVYGVIELASFKVYEPFEVQFVEKLAESFASAIANVKNNEQTKRLLVRTQMMAEELRAQEEEMRQNMEELQATQEEMQRRIRRENTPVEQGEAAVDSQ